MKLNFLVLAAGVTLTQAGRFLHREVEVKAPKTDRRGYKYTSFENGLSVLAVQDKKAAKAGFAVAVSAGSFYDPVEFPGLAHFCEHLLFLGTKKYPDETAFDNYLSQHAGSNNAYTEQEKTVFYNEISHSGFDEGMDRFAQFFIAPLFKQEMVGRELNAVNSEHEKNIPDQGRRMWELMRSTAKNSSVLSHFYTGTVESLHHGDNKTVAALKKYHEENYCATRMTLVMVSNRSLDDQLAVAHSHFDGVPRGQCSPVPRDFADKTTFADAESRDQLIEFHTDSAPQLQLMFPTRPTKNNYKAQPAAMLTYALAYAGPKSLKSELKKRDLASDLGVQVDETSAGSLVFLTVDLTPGGMKDVGSVTNVIFDYVRRVRSSAKKDIETVYPSMQKMQQVNFDYMEQPDSVMEAVSQLAADAMHFLPEDVISGGQLVDKMDPELVLALIEDLNEDNVNIAIATNEFDEKRANMYNKYYKVHYARNPIPAAMRKSWGTPIVGADFQPPPPFMYVPSNLTVLVASAGEIPNQAAAKSGEEVWWLGRGAFPLPKAQLRVKLSVPLSLFATVEYSVLRTLHVEMANRGLEEPMEDLGNCGLNWDLKEVSSGYQIHMDGYSEHIDALVEKVTSGFANPSQNDAARFEQVRRKIKTDLEDATAKMPYEHAMEALSAISTNGVFGREETLDALAKISSARFATYIGELKTKGLRVQLLATGNLDEAKASKLAEVLTNKLGASKVLGHSQAAKPLALKVEGAPIELRKRNPIPGDANSATVNSYQFGNPDVAERVKLLMLSQMISNPVYDELRTKEQLGYVVFGQIMPHVDTLQLTLIVQGAEKGPDYVDGRIEMVLDKFDQTLKNTSRADFLRWKASLRATINRDDQNMAQEADRLWSHIASDDGQCFNRKHLALDYLDSLDSVADVSEVFKRFRVHPRKISVRLFGAKEVMNTTSTYPEPASFVVSDDWSVNKVAVSKDRSYYQDETVCKIHRSK